MARTFRLAPAAVAVSPGCRLEVPSYVLPDLPPGTAPKMGRGGERVAGVLFGAFLALAGLYAVLYGVATSTGYDGGADSAFEGLSVVAVATLALGAGFVALWAAVRRAPWRRLYVICAVVSVASFVGCFWLIESFRGVNFAHSFSCARGLMAAGEATTASSVHAAVTTSRKAASPTPASMRCTYSLSV